MKQRIYKTYVTYRCSRDKLLHIFIHKVNVVILNVSLDSKIYVVGGQLWNKENKYSVEIFDGENWETGPEYPFHLNKVKNQAGLDDKKRIIIVSKTHGIIIYNTLTGVFSAHEEFRMKDKV